ncbi:uncharacterized protein LOC8279798 [Ricinus communis]|uniref:uncharacterized protein LOC8279798 n=1 Tax=Ricinus communis TaxID=3988 RepID=UPI00201A7F87|nr:uncharacterized protein LOC8279798 [Ricinus communis]
MEDLSRLKLNSRDQQSLGTSETVTTRARQSLTLHDRLKTERATLLYTDLCHQYRENIRHISPKRSGDFLKQCRKATQEEELVKYMSHLPSYLERGEYRQEKVLNVGVLDWGQLEKWQCSQKQIWQRSSRPSLSNGNSSSSLSTEGSSVNSSSCQCHPAHQRLHRPSLKFHLMSSPAEVKSQDGKSFEESSKKVQHVKGVQTNTMNEQESVRTDRPFSTKFAEIKLDSCSRKNLDLKINPKSGTFNGANFEAMQKLKVKTYTRDGEYMKTVNKLQGQKAYATEKDVSENTRRVVLHSRDLFQGDRSQLSESITMSGREGAEASRRSFSEMPESSPEVVSSDVPHSCPLICENSGCTDIKWCFSDVESASLLPDSSQSVPHPTKRGISPSHNRISEIKKSSIAPITSTSKDPSTGLELNLSKAAAEKPRSISPFRRLTIGIGRMSKSFNSKDDSSLPRLSTARSFAKSTTENAMPPSFQSTSSDMQNATSRARSSPLRRLLDPLLKPKAPNCHQSGELLQQDSVLKERVCKSSRGQVDSSIGARQPGIVKLDIASCREINIDDSTQGKKSGTSAFQAFLQVATKNGQPVFTFAVGNERNVLAATMKKLSSSREDDYSCIYTFIAFKDVRKKNGRWINQGGKYNSHDYIPNVVAQLKVSGSQFSQSFTREFVLFSVDLRQAEQQTLGLEANDELAAIVVKIPKVINKCTSRDGHRSSKCTDFPDVRYDSTSGEHCMINVQSLISTTVILPSGVHSLPNKGGPSSLIQRWRSGGSCDCGGWDLGCKLKIFANDSQHIKKSCSSKPCAISDKFELISQGSEEENRPVFSLAPFKDGIYSVEFNSSLSILQAFSLCIAVLDSKRLCETLESSNLNEGKTSLETILAQNDGIRVAPNGNDGEVPARYVSNPPHSPVGRV